MSLQEDDEKMVQCPYNKSHIILESRMPAHLTKCRLQHPCTDFISCPFNSTHDVLTKEFEHHIEYCPDRVGFESSIYVIDDPRPEAEDFGAYHIDLPPCGENWDEETKEGSSYLDVKEDVLKKQQIFRIPVGKSKSERKAFIQGEVERFRNITENKPLLNKVKVEKETPAEEPSSSFPTNIIPQRPQRPTDPRLGRGSGRSTTVGNDLIPLSYGRTATQSQRPTDPRLRRGPSPRSPGGDDLIPLNYGGTVQQPQRPTDPRLRRAPPHSSLGDDYIPISYGRGYRLN